MQRCNFESWPQWERCLGPPSQPLVQNSFLGIPLRAEAAWISPTVKTFVIYSSFGRGVANSVAIVIKVVGYPARSLHFIAYAIASIVINPIFGVVVELTVIHVVWAITHVVRRILHIELAVLHVVGRTIKICDLGKAVLSI